MMVTPLDQILVQALGQYDFFGSGAVVKKVAEKLATKGYTQELEAPGENIFDAVVQLLADWGTVLEQRPTDGLVMAVVGSGTANMNPTALIVRVQGSKVEAIGAAKEGLINQHSGEKAVVRLLSALQHAR